MFDIWAKTVKQIHAKQHSFCAMEHFRTDGYGLVGPNQVCQKGVWLSMSVCLSQDFLKLQVT
jgi:hypothetical protein